MRPVKRLEIVVEAIELDNVIKVLDALGVVGYTILRHVGGRGDRYELENVYIIIACDAAQAAALVSAIRPILKRFGGMCLLSDAQWVIHKD
jgi:nitrogen regulatory protein PII